VTVKRTPLNQRQKALLLEKQGELCAVTSCRVPIGNGKPFEDDHHLALIDGGTNELSNRRLICIPCHKVKSAIEHKNNAKAKRIKFGKTKRFRRMSKDPRNTIEFQIEYAAHAVRLAVNDMVNLAKQYPNLVREELPELSNANDDLAVLVATLTVREAAE
jgi:hypothetical protein